MNYLKHLFDGIVIGIANIIPGVSGGTMALVLGIYERIILAINNISLNTIKAVFGILRFKKESFETFKIEMKKIDVLFLISIKLGALVAIIAFAKLMAYLLKDLHDPTYGFFFGLVIVSIIAPYKLIRKKTIVVILFALIGVGAIFGVSQSVSGKKLLKKAQIKQELKVNAKSVSYKKNEVNKQKIIKYLFFFIAGAITVSAMILPGISGSLLLIIMGGYFELLLAINNVLSSNKRTMDDIILIGVFLFGCIFGIIVFSRLLNFLLKKWHDETMSFLTGLVIGSLWMIWPFKTSAVVGGETIYMVNCIPEAFGKMELYTILSCIIGMILVAVFLFMDDRRKKRAEVIN